MRTRAEFLLLDYSVIQLVVSMPMLADDGVTVSARYLYALRMFLLYSLVCNIVRLMVKSRAFRTIGQDLTLKMFT